MKINHIILTGFFSFAILFTSCTREESFQPDPQLQRAQSDRPESPIMDKVVGRIMPFSPRGGNQHGSKSIRGIVVDHHGFGLASVAVNLYEPGTTNLLNNTTSDAAGSYEMDPVDMGDYDLELNLSGYEIQLHPVSVGDTLDRRDTLL